MKDNQERYFRIENLIHYSDQEARKNIFFQSHQSAGAVWCIKPGQFLKAHKHECADDIWVILEGEGEFVTNNNERKVISKGDIIVSSPGDVHGVYNKGTSNFVMLGFATPMPLDFIEC